MMTRYDILTTILCLRRTRLSRDCVQAVGFAIRHAIVKEQLAISYTIYGNKLQPDHYKVIFYTHAHECEAPHEEWQGLVQSQWVNPLHHAVVWRGMWQCMNRARFIAT